MVTIDHQGMESWNYKCAQGTNKLIQRRWRHLTLKNNKVTCITETGNGKVAIASDQQTMVIHYSIDMLSFPFEASSQCQRACLVNVINSAKIQGWPSRPKRFNGSSQWYLTWPKCPLTLAIVNWDRASRSRRRSCHLNSLMDTSSTKMSPPRFVNDYLIDTITLLHYTTCKLN